MRGGHREHLSTQLSMFTLHGAFTASYITRPNDAVSLSVHRVFSCLNILSAAVARMGRLKKSAKTSRLKPSLDAQRWPSAAPLLYGSVPEGAYCSSSPCHGYEASSDKRSLGCVSVEDCCRAPAIRFLCTAAADRPAYTTHSIAARPAKASLAVQKTALLAGVLRLVVPSYEFSLSGNGQPLNR